MEPFQSCLSFSASLTPASAAPCPCQWRTSRATRPDFCRATLFRRHGRDDPPCVAEIGSGCVGLHSVHGFCDARLVFGPGLETEISGDDLCGVAPVSRQSRTADVFDLYPLVPRSRQTSKTIRYENKNMI